MSKMEANLETGPKENEWAEGIRRVLSRQPETIWLHDASVGFVETVICRDDQSVRAKRIEDRQEKPA